MSSLIELPISVSGCDAHLQSARGDSSCGIERETFVRSSKNGFGRARPRVHQLTTFMARVVKTPSDGGGGAFDGSGPVAERSKMRHSGKPSNASRDPPAAPQSMMG